MNSKFKELILTDKVLECDSIMSLYFKSKDNSKLKKHTPGQFLPFKIKTDDIKYKDELRTYSLSNYPNESIYRISVKKVPGGLISSYLHDEIKIGDSILAMEPAGIFTLKNRPDNSQLVLISGGIGITPLLSMLYSESKNTNNIHFIQALQNSNIHPFKEDIKFIAKNTGIKNTVFYDSPLPQDLKDVDYDVAGRINKDWIKDNLSLNSDFYFCGPPPFMKALENSLLELGVPSERINYEFFS